jgi:tRNA-uridine 2-sulfurtransferase
MLPLLPLSPGRTHQGPGAGGARERGLITAEKPESQEICFVPDGDYRGFLAKRLAPRHPALEPGAIVDLEGRVLGEHRGYAGFTVGQRRGLGGGFPEPLFVVEVRPATREVVVGPREALDAGTMSVEELHWLAPDLEPRPGLALGVQIRHRAGSVPGTVEAVAGSGAGGGSLAWRFDDPQAAVTPGQSAVFFHRDRVLGGGRISAAFRPSRQTAPSPRAPRR